jgi:uncharacterized membrane protein YkgB
MEPRKEHQFMYHLAILAQIIVALSVTFVWVVHFPNVVNEFHEYNLSDGIRTLVGATKISLATLLIAGIWYPRLVLIPAIFMAILMACALVAHLRVHHVWSKFVPAFVLLLLCVFIIGQYSRGSAV